MEEIITAEAKKQVLQQRIAELELELYRLNLQVDEFTPVIATHGNQTDAAQIVANAQVGIQATQVRLGVLRARYKQEFGPNPDPEAVEGNGAAAPSKARKTVAKATKEART